MLRLLLCLTPILWLGLFPGPVLRRLEPSSRRFIELVRERAPEAPMVVPPPVTVEMREPAPRVP